MKCQHGVDVFGRCAPCEEGAYLILISELKAELAAARAEIERMTGELASANRECEVRNERELGYLARAQSAEADLAALRAERDALRAAGKDALHALTSSRVFVTSRERCHHPDGTAWYDERVERLRAALEER